MPRIGKRAAVALAVVVTGGVLAGGVVAAQRDASTALETDEIEAAIEATTMAKVADIAAGEGYEAHGVFVQELETGHLCVWDALSATSRLRQGGCNTIDDLLGETVLFANLAYDGGPAIEGVKDARVSGVAASSVASVTVLMSDGSERSVRLTKTHLRAGDFMAFGYRFKKSDLKRGIGPIAIVAYDAGGAELGRQPTGIG